MKEYSFPKGEQGATGTPSKSIQGNHPAKIKLKPQSPLSIRNTKEHRPGIKSSHHVLYYSLSLDSASTACCYLDKNEMMGLKQF